MRFQRRFGAAQRGGRAGYPGRDSNSGEGDTMKQFLNRLWRDESGQDATEYVLLVVLIALAITAGMTVLATGINGAFSNAATSLNAASGS